MAETPTPTTLDALAGAIASRSAARTIVAIAGAPGSGKSTLAEALEARLNEAHAGSAAILPMDGYHYDDLVLVPRGLRPRKGAPETFDVSGLRHMLGRLRRNEEEEIAVPVFDRDLEIARAAARVIPREVRHLLVEGLYLLLDQPPWSALKPMFDMTVWIDVPEAELRRRLAARWEGYRMTPAEIETKLEDNDLPNGRLIVARSRPADFVLRPE